jgi:hypothetical protein
MTKIQANQVAVNVTIANDSNQYMSLQELLRFYEDQISYLDKRVKQLEEAYIESQFLFKKEE